MCPSGSESTAKYCGFGLGERGTCVPCPTGTYRSQDNELDQKCRPCSSCDPDAVILANCSASADTQCGPCKPGMYNVSGFCVSCKDHPNEERCGVETTTGTLTTTEVATTTGTTTTGVATTSWVANTPPTPPDCPTSVNETVILGVQRPLVPQGLDYFLFLAGGFILGLLSCFGYWRIKKRERGTESTNFSPEDEKLLSHTSAAANLQSNNRAGALPPNGDVELGPQPVESPQPQVVTITQTPDPVQTANTRDASVQADSGQQDAQQIKVQEMHHDEDQAAKVPLLDGKQGATPSTLTSHSSGSRRKTKRSSRPNPLLKGVLDPQKRDSVGTDDEITAITDEMKTREASLATAGGAFEVDTPTDSANYSGSTSATSSLSFEDEINRNFADPPALSAAAPLSDDTLQRPKSSITNTSVCSDDAGSEDTVIFNLLAKSDKALLSATTSNNVAIPDALPSLSRTGSLHSVDETAVPDDTPVERRSECDVAMAEVGKAREKSKRYHLADLDTKICHELGLKLNPERGPSFPYVETLAGFYPIERDTYNNFQRGYIFQDMITYLKRDCPGKFTADDLLDKLIKIKRLDAALILAVHINKGNLQNTCDLCKLHKTAVTCEVSDGIYSNKTQNALNGSTI